VTFARISRPRLLLFRIRLTPLFRHCPPIRKRRSRRQQSQDRQRDHPEINTEINSQFVAVYRDRNTRHRVPAQQRQRQKRCDRESEFLPRVQLRLNLNHWCTGEDSNLRTSLGGTDLQSVGFNHSPTCAETSSRPRPRAVSMPPRRGTPPCRAAARAHQPQTKPSTSHAAFATQGNQGSRFNAAKTTTRRKSSEWSASGKTCCAAADSCPAGKFVYSFLELAKGFEPPTL
jgi:hypothetical protein